MEDKIILNVFATRLSYLIKNNNTDINKLVSDLGLKSKTTIYRYMKSNGIHSLKKAKPNQRNVEIKKLRNEGKTYQEIASLYNISKQRVEQIIHEYY